MADAAFSALWAGFRGKGGTERDRVIVGVAAAFAYVAVANGELQPSETARFLDLVRASRLAASDGDTEAELSLAFRALTRALLACPDGGRSACLELLSDFAFDPMRSEIIWSATRAALLADSALDAAERRAEADIREALRIGAADR